MTPYGLFSDSDAGSGTTLVWYRSFISLSSYRGVKTDVPSTRSAGVWVG